MTVKMSLKYHSYTGVFSTHFASKYQPPGLSINRTLAGNRLMKFLKFLKKFDEVEDNRNKTIAIFTEHGSEN